MALYDDQERYFRGLVEFLQEVDARRRVERARQHRCCLGVIRRQASCVNASWISARTAWLTPPPTEAAEPRQYPLHHPTVSSRSFAGLLPRRAIRTLIPPWWRAQQRAEVATPYPHATALGECGDDPRPSTMGGAASRSDRTAQGVPRASTITAL